jgi:peptidoglycan/LPS O-acetylase OafA/YrhL
MMKGFGAKTISYDPMLDYWLRMTAGAFTMIGCLFLGAAVWIHRFLSLIPWLGGLLVAEGVILLVHGMRLSLPPFPFYGDVAACIGGGGAILFLASSTRKQVKEP